MRKLLYCLTLIGLIFSVNVYSDEASKPEAVVTEKKIEGKITINQDPVSGRSLSNVLVSYKENYPNVYGKGVLVGMLQVMRKTFGTQNLEITELSEQDKIADKVLVKSGYSQMPTPLLTALVDDLKKNNIAATAEFNSAIRANDLVEKTRTELNKLPVIAKENIDYNLIVLPFRASYISDNKIKLHIAVLLFNKKENKWEKFKYYITCELEENSIFDDTDGKKFSATIMSALKQAGWLH
jgi:hypothetical protein